MTKSESEGRWRRDRSDVRGHLARVNRGRNFFGAIWCDLAGFGWVRSREFRISGRERGMKLAKRTEFRLEEVKVGQTNSLFVSEWVRRLLGEYNRIGWGCKRGV
jgi:hypothetical protein